MAKARLNPTLRALSIPCALLIVAAQAASGAPAGGSVGEYPSRSADSLYHEARPAMGTTVEVHLYAPDAFRAAELMEAAFAEVERVEAALSTYRPTSELTRINTGAVDMPLTTDPETFALIREALHLSERTGGAFDITVGPLVRAWGFLSGKGRIPSSSELAEARAATGWQHVALDEAGRTVHFLAPGLALDLGSIGKGRALDSAARVLRGHGVAAALLGAGRSSYYAVGAPPGTEGWQVSIPDPADPGRVLSRVHLRDRSLSTSGSSDQYFDRDGRRYGHVIDPRTGEPSAGVAQVTVTAPRATDSDALATALFVLGRERAGELIAETDGAEALLVTEDEGSTEVVPIRWTGELRAPGRSSARPAPTGEAVP
jgi:thiamine biosynthesis lipoprotein